MWVGRMRGASRAVRSRVGRFRVLCGAAAKILLVTINSS
uniref:Uncharacterized protein n=1 Tax=Arundo donax TaxID=35708 RepID=A0A0A9BXP3_ARUDO